MIKSTNATKASFTHPFFRNFRRIPGCIIYAPASNGEHERMQCEVAVYVEDIDSKCGFTMHKGKIWLAEKRALFGKNDGEDGYFLMFRIFTNSEFCMLTNDKEVA